MKQKPDYSKQILSHSLHKVVITCTCDYCSAMEVKNCGDLNIDFKGNEPLLSVLNNDPTADCTFCVGEENLKAHTELLIQKSPVFKNMFIGHMASSEIKISDISLEQLTQMLEFVYRGTTAVNSVSNAWDLFYVANKYLLDDLKKFCIDYISRKLCMSNLVLCYEYAELFNATEFKDKCFADIIYYVKGIFLTDYHMKPSTLCSILHHRYLDITSFELVIKILDWAITHCEYKTVNISPENVIRMLQESDVIGCIKKNWLVNSKCNYCSNSLVMCQCLSEFLQNIIHLVDSVICWADSESDHIENRSQKYLQNCTLRSVYKIANRIVLHRSEEIISNVNVNQTLYVFGLLVDTVNDNLYTDDCYEGSITVRICEENTNCDIVKPTVVKDLMRYNRDYYVSLSELAVFEPNVSYDIKISYRDTLNQSTPILFHYMSNVLTNKSKETAIQFNEMFGTVIRGICFYTA